MDPAAVLSLADHVIPLSAAIHWPEAVGCGLPDAPVGKADRLLQPRANSYRLVEKSEFA